jgi:hypothetical protein
MPGTTADLTIFMTDSITTFNSNVNHVNPDMRPFLDQDVILISIKKQLIYTGIDAVYAFFNVQFQDDPTFTPIPVQTPAVSSDGFTGYVSGNAKWKDNNGSEGIRYVFTFVWRPANTSGYGDAGAGWRLSSISGT